MSFNSILFDKSSEDFKKEINEEPQFFLDLNLDQIVDKITAGKEEYNLKPFFYSPLSEVKIINYRQEIIKDLENKTLFELIKSFAEKMRKTRQLFNLVNDLDSKYNKEGWFLEAVERYCKAIIFLADNLKSIELKSEGLLDFRKYLISYRKSDYFLELQEEKDALKNELSELKYSLYIKGDRVRVQEYQGESDYGPEVEKTFVKFKQESAKNYKSDIASGTGMNHIEARIINLVARLNPEIFSRLDRYYQKNKDCIDQKISEFDREIHFYISYLEHMNVLKRSGLKFCYPEVSKSDKQIYNQEGYDLALADKLRREDETVVPNDYYLNHKERIFVVTGPNQGGKTTFARTVGQLHYLAKLGLPVPGSKSRCYLYDRLFTHFEREEDIKNLRGKLEDDLIRVKKILNQATSESLIIINEIFASTTGKDAIYLGKRILKKMMEKDVLAVCVTFLDELTFLNDQTVSMVAQVDPEDPNIRTYKIKREAADGVAYAVSIAQKHGLTYDCLKERIGS